MGNQVPQLYNSNRVIQQIYDERFGGKIILEYQKPQIYATKSIRLISKQQLQSTVNLITKRSKLIHKNFSTVKNYHIRNVNDLCSEIITLNLVFQYYENDLQKQIMRRSPKNEYFTQQDICRKIFQICDCLSYLQDRNCYHGDINSSTIFIDKKNNVRLQDSYFTHHGKTNLEFMISKPNVITYLSPSQLQLLRNCGYVDKAEQTYKNQIFSMGMTILEAMLLTSSHDCYDMLSKKINVYKVNQKLGRAKTFYSENLVNLISKILEVDQNKRPKYIQILGHPIIKSFGSNKLKLISEIRQNGSNIIQRLHTNINQSNAKLTESQNFKNT